MEPTRNTRKRAGTSTHAVPSVPAQRVRALSRNQHTDGSDLPQYYNAGLSCTHDDLLEQFPIQAHLHWPIPATSYLPYHSDAPRVHSPPQSNPRKESLLALQPTLRPKLIDITIPNRNVDISFPSDFRTVSDLQPVLTPPRSHPSISTLVSSSRPSLSHCSPISPRLSFSSSTTLCSPLSPLTPQTSTNVFTAAAEELTRNLMADELGMTSEDVQDLNDFATVSRSKREGRVLVPKAIRQRKEARHKKQNSRTMSGERFVEANLWWREINWSRFSDDSSSDGDDGSDFDFDAGLESDDALDVYGLGGISPCQKDLERSILARLDRRISVDSDSERQFPQCT